MNDLNLNNKNLNKFSLLCINLWLVNNSILKQKPSHETYETAYNYKAFLHSILLFSI